MASSTPSNVVQLQGLQMPGLGIAQTSSKGTLFAGSRNEVWYCTGYTNGTQGLMLFVKPDLPLRSMMIEALAAQVGQCMGLPCPDPFIVTVNPKHIGRPGGPKIVAFGSEQKGRALARPILDTDLMLQLIEKQKLTDQLCCFDELIANGVRSHRDVVFEPENGISIIDHEGAMEISTQASDSVTNWVATQVLSRLTVDQRVLFLKRLRARAAAAHRLTFGGPPLAVQFNQEGVPTYRKLVEFLQARLLHLDTLLSNRVFPEQRHIMENSNSNDSIRATDV